MKDMYEYKRFSCKCIVTCIIYICTMYIQIYFIIIEYVSEESVM